MNKRLFSVVIPAYNYAHTLVRAVESVLGQADEDTELLVINDGATDRTRQVIAELLSRYGGRFTAIHQDNAGLAATRNRGIDETRGTWLVFLDADDELAPGALTHLRSAVMANPEMEAIFGAHVVITPDGKRRLRTRTPIPGSRRVLLRQALLEGGRFSINNGATALHRRVFEHYRYPERFRCCEDLSVYANVLGNYRCMTLDAPVAIIHKHEDSMRHDIERQISLGAEQLTDEVFAESRISPDLMGLKSAFLTSRLPSTFKSLYRNGQDDSALLYWKRAIRHSPMTILRIRYLCKAIHARFRKRSRQAKAANLDNSDQRF